MVRTAIWTVVLVSVATIAFFAGRGFQHTKSGYYFMLMDEQEFPYAPDASIRLQHAIKNVGLPFMTPESSILTLEESSGGKITLYEAQRVFQESYPCIENVAVKGDDIAWSDGRYRYRLTITTLASKTATNTDE